MRRKQSGGATRETDHHTVQNTNDQSTEGIWNRNNAPHPHGTTFWYKTGQGAHGSLFFIHLFHQQFHSCPIWIVHAAHDVQFDMLFLTHWNKVLSPPIVVASGRSKAASVSNLPRLLSKARSGR